MRDLELGRVLRALRRRRGWRQADCAGRASVDRSTWSNLERGQLDRMSLRTVRACLAVLDVRLELVPRWRGAGLDRLLDERHAALEAGWKPRLERWGWQVWPEVSFNRYGERGRIDLLAWFPPRRILLVAEIKSEIVDIQALLGGLDVKRRLAPFVARQVGLPAPAFVVPLLLVADGSTNRGRVRRVDSLFTLFDRRGRQAVAWLRRPAGQVGGLLVFSELRNVNAGRATSVAPHRVRVRQPRESVARAPQPAPERPRPAYGDVGSHLAGREAGTSGT